MDDQEYARALAESLWLLLWELHPHYSNTSRRGRGIGGQAMTQQCNVIDPEGWEFEALDEAEDILRSYLRQNPHSTEEIRKRWQAETHGGARTSTGKASAAEHLANMEQVSRQMEDVTDVDEEIDRIRGPHDQQRGET